MPPSAHVNNVNEYKIIHFDCQIGQSNLTNVILSQFSHFNKKKRKKKQKSLAPIKKLRIKTTTKNSLYGARKRNNKSKHVATGQHNQALNLKPFFWKNS